MKNKKRKEEKMSLEEFKERFKKDVFQVDDSNLHIVNEEELNQRKIITVMADSLVEGASIILKAKGVKH